MCAPIQQQTGPSHSFDPDFIFSETGSYFEPFEEYFNETNKVGSKFTLSCYLEGKNIPFKTPKLKFENCDFRRDYKHIG